jgi:hypothetical protein
VHMNTQIIPLPAHIAFSQSAEEELVKLNAEMRIISILNVLADNRAPSPQEVSDLRHMMLVLADLFSTSLPPLEENPMDMLRAAARDIRLASLLKERGLARIYRMSTLQVQEYDELTRQNILLPAFMTEVNPETNKRFASKEELLGWFCSNAHVSRSLVFLRMATYDRMLGLGMSLEDAFDTVVKKPYATGQALKELETRWNGGDLVGMDPDVAVRLTKVMLPEKLEEVEELTSALQTEQSTEAQEHLREELIETVKPALVNLLKEVAEHPSMRDAMDMVRHDIAGRPEIKYWWDPDRSWLQVQYLRKKKDIEGTEYVAEVEEIYLIPEKPLSQEIVEDLAKRLHVKNRDPNLR